MKKIVINACHGGFGLSHKAMMRYFELKDIEVYPEEFNSYYSIWTYYLLPPEERKVLPEGSDVVETLEASMQNSMDQVFYDWKISRDDPTLVQVVEEFGEDSWGSYAELKVVEIPNDVEWEINEYDGREWVAEKHRTWS